MSSIPDVSAHPDSRGCLASGGEKHFLRRRSTASSRRYRRRPASGAPRGKVAEMAAHDALRTILPVAGLSEERARTVEITSGGDPVLPTPFRIGETSAAALAATGLA